ncbi:MAG: formylglycine-generating enzyme family protein [FCB group bacterium]|nr:formylglycine-generating enzyme family protein [FCB group bacterium]
MKLILRYGLSFLFVVFGASQTASITNVQAQQRTDGSQIVDIAYELTGDLPSYNITIQVSFDNGVTFENIFLVSGDVGINITTGNQKMINWNFGVEFPYQYSDSTRVKIIGDSGNQSTIEFVNVAAGPYTQGQNDNIATIDYDYQIMKYEVTNFQFAQFLQYGLAAGYITASPDTVIGFYQGDAHYSSGEYPFIDLSKENCRIMYQNGFFVPEIGYEDFPVVAVSKFGASTFAAEYGWELPEHNEWEKAARGTTGWDFAYGDQLLPHWANYNGSGDPFDDGPTPVGYYGGVGHQGYWVGDAHSPYGTYDMTGNVSEIMRVNVSQTPIVGGNWNSYDLYTTPLHVWYVNSYVSGNMYDTVGFRCVKYD